MMKKVSIILALLICITMCACSENNVSGSQRVSDFETKNYSVDEHFIFTADLPPVISEHALQTYKECGFTNYVIIPWSSYNAFFPDEGVNSAEEAKNTQFASAINLIDNAGLKTFVRGFGTRESIEKFSLFDFTEIDAFEGFYITDEPGGASFDAIAEIVEYWNDNYSDSAIWHLNLFPSYASNTQLGTTFKNGKSAYENYIDEYVEKVFSKVQGKKEIGMDHYALRERNGLNYISDMMIYDLMCIAQAAKQTNSYVHNCIQTSSGHTQTRIISSASELRWQYYISLAFGARSFEAFAYQDDANLHFDCIIGSAIHDLYYFHQEVSEELKRFEDVYLYFDWQGVKTFVGTKNEDGYNSAFDNISSKTLSSLSGIKNVSADQDTIIGEFKNGNDNAFLVANYTDPADAILDNVIIKFNNCKKVIVYRGGRPIKYEITNNELSLPLIGGEGVFVIPVE